MFGGFSEYVNQNTIAKFATTTRSWTRLGQMRRARNGLGVVTVGDNFLVVGGQITNGQANVAEACNLQVRVDDKKYPIKSLKGNCAVTQISTAKYEHYPLMLLVGNDFCTV